MRLEEFQAKVDSTVQLSYVFRDDVGNPLTSSSEVTVDIYSFDGRIIEHNLSTTGGPKYMCSYTIPSNMVFGAYLIEWRATIGGRETCGYSQLSVVAVTDAEFNSSVRDDQQSVTLDGISVSFDSQENRIKALNSLRAPQVGRIHKYRNPLDRAGLSQIRDYKRW